MKNGALKRNGVARDGVCGGFGVIGGDLWWLGRSL
jgi:hypothetical protein